MYIKRTSLILPNDNVYDYIHNFCDIIVESLTQFGIEAKSKKFSTTTNLASTTNVSDNDLPAWIEYNATPNKFISQSETNTSSNYHPSRKTLGLVYWIVDNIRYSVFIGGAYYYPSSSDGIGIMLTVNTNELDDLANKNNIWSSWSGNYTYQHQGFGYANYRDRLTIAKGINNFVIFIENDYKYNGRLNIMSVGHIKTNYEDGVYVPRSSYPNKYPTGASIGSTIRLGSLSYAMGKCSTAIGDPRDKKQYLFDIHMGIENSLLFGKCIDLYSIPFGPGRLSEIINIGGIPYVCVGDGTYTGYQYMKV